MPVIARQGSSSGGPTGPARREVGRSATYAWIGQELQVSPGLRVGHLCVDSCRDTPTVGRLCVDGRGVGNVCATTHRIRWGPVRVGRGVPCFLLCRVWRRATPVSSSSCVPPRSCGTRTSRRSGSLRACSPRPPCRIKSRRPRSAGNAATATSSSASPPVHRASRSASCPGCCCTGSRPRRYGPRVAS